MSNNNIFNIILVDDDEDDRILFSEALEEVSIKSNLLLFKHGQELIDYLFNTEIVLPDLIFLDLNMPIKNGMQCLSDIRSNPRFKDIHIAMYSTSMTDKDIKDSFSNGANIYVNKPNCFNKLKNTVEKILQLNWKDHIQNLNFDTFLFRI
ncbi:response regulator [Mariniflexile gromovii]|uniref:Response regulator n=1 Tax=Mariniflexile gromovii TaxID=362523 RepID=A0ABS4BRG8_9FLAO|nr:response regulator [Mariniflexile gromovii]MBP0903159.1 response regulator [Mariniflexile gromovii]